MNASSRDKVTRDDARRIAEEYLAENRVEATTGTIWKVVAWDEIEWRKPAAYARPTSEWENQWIVYLEQEGCAIRSSMIISVDQETGEVTYAGAAHDEG